MRFTPELESEFNGTAPDELETPSESVFANSTSRPARTKRSDAMTRDGHNAAGEPGVDFRTHLCQNRAA